ncbi:MAG TPA: lamin tail domain-containing protein, partial [Verrucomicrobiae bacterium]
DYTNVFSLVNAANSHGTPNYVANMENIADMENWMRVFAANHAAGNWDSFGAQNAQNLYGYIGAQGTKYSLHMWDFNIVLGNSGSWSPGQDLFTVNGADPNTADIYSNPTFLRMYWRAMQELVNGPLTAANSSPLLNAKYTAFTQNGQNVENPTSAIEPWLASAKSSIASQIAAVNASSFTVSTSVTQSNNVALVTGTAPFNVATIDINGAAYPLSWTSLTQWTVSVPLTNGANVLNITGINHAGTPIAGDSQQLTVNSTKTVPAPAGHVVVNEIMYNPAVPGGQYIELYNNSATSAYDLSGWQLPEINYTFPSGAIIIPQGYLTLAASRPAFAAAYGATKPVFDTFGEPLGDGQMLTLEQPTNANNAVVAQVEYDSVLPWPTNAATPGVSLQLIDPAQDNWRAGNWSAGSANTPPFTPQWVEASVSGPATSSLLYIYLQSAGDVYIDDIKVVAGSVPDVGANMLKDGDFESGFPGVWSVSPNLTGSALSATVKHSGNASLHIISTAAGTTQSSAIYQTMSPALTGSGTYTISYWYLQSTNGGPLTVRLSGSGIVDTVNPAPQDAGATAFFTPDALNSVAETLPPFAPLWINEVEPANITGITNSAGQHAPWVELYNPTTNTVALTNLWLSTDYNNLAAWAFPAGVSVDPGQFLIIFADGQTNLSTAQELHTSFALESTSGSLALSRLFEGQPQALDYVNYNNIQPDWSYGSNPDGQSFVRQAYYSPTPGAANANTGALLSSFIAYNTPGSLYTQNFDALPDPGATSVNSDNPVTIDGVTYSLANPYDFAFPAMTNGSAGGLGLAGLAGWYGSSSLLTRFGATDGDQTTGGQISFGLPNSGNRALGLLATSTTGTTAFGAKIINNTGAQLNSVTVQATGELWRQSNLPKTLQCYYAIDPTATAPMPGQATGTLPTLNVIFPTDSGAAGGVAVDGTATANQTQLSANNQPVTWPAGAALWLIWQMTDPTGKAQGLAIDNLTFTASTSTGTTTNGPVLSLQTSPTGPFTITWPASASGYQLYTTTNLTPPTVWTLVTGQSETNGTFFLPILPTNAGQFFRLSTQQ